MPARMVVFVSGLYAKPEARRDRAVVSGNQAARALPSRPRAGEDQRARIVVHRRIRLGRREIRILVAARHRRQREFVAQAVIENQLAADAPVVLRVKSPVAVDLLEVADRFGGAGVSVAEQERRKGTAAGGRVTPGTAVSRKLKAACPAMFCWPNPLASWWS